MMNSLLVILALLVSDAQAMSETHPGEFAVPAYTQSNENAGADPVSNPAVLEAFGGQPGINSIVDSFVDRIIADPRIEGIFRAHDDIRFRRTLKEQFCYILGGGCAYTGMDMAMTHKDHGITTREFNIVVEHLQHAMDENGVPFGMQNKLLAKLAPMHRDIATR